MNGCFSPLAERTAEIVAIRSYHVLLESLFRLFSSTNTILSVSIQKSQNTPGFSQASLSFHPKKLSTRCYSKSNLNSILLAARDQDGYIFHWKENFRRTFLFLLLSSGLFPTLPSSGKTKKKNPYDEKRLIEQNKRIQKENNAPEDFPNFVREGFEVKVLTSENYVTSDTGLIYRDIEVGKGDCPKAGQQVTFHYIGYNESGRRIDSTYLQGRPANIRLGTNALVPGFEEGIRDMRPGGKEE